MGFLDGVTDIGGDLMEFGTDVITGNPDMISSGFELLKDGGEAAAGGMQFQADITRWTLEQAWNGGNATVDFIGNGFGDITHPGDPTPPAAQGLAFAESKGASDLAYDAELGETYEFANGTQWTVIDVEDDAQTGFRAIALESTDPADDRVIVAFAGSDDGADWVNNIEQGLGLSADQYEQADAFAAKWKEAEGNNVRLTGHSLGGGLASYAAIENNLHATGINSAPLAANHVGLNPFDWARITQYYVPGEALSILNEANPLDFRPGLNIAVEGEGSILDPRSIGSNHGLANVAPDIALPVEVE